MRLTNYFFTTLLIILFAINLLSLAKYFVVSQVTFDLAGTNQTEVFQIFFNLGNGILQSNSVVIPIVNQDGFYTYSTHISAFNLKELRFDPAIRPGIQTLRNLTIGGKIIETEDFFNYFEINNDTYVRKLTNPDHLGLVNIGRDPSLSTSALISSFKIDSRYLIIAITFIAVLSAYLMLSKHSKSMKYIQNLNLSLNSFATENERLLLACLLCVFALQAITYAHTNKLWDYPDEIGHYSYIAELSEGKLPRLTHSKLDSTAVGSWPNAKVVTNWIAQHPPTYYASLIPLYKLVSLLSDSIELKVRLLRTVSVGYAITGLLFIYLIVKKLGCKPALALGATLIISSIPMLVNLSGAISNDTALFALMSVAIYYFIALAKSFKLEHFILFAIFASLAILTKFTALPLLILPCLIAFVLLLANEKKILKIIISILPFFSVAGFFMINYLSYGSITADFSIVDSATSEHAYVAIDDFVTSYPVFNNIFNTFFASFGWNGWGSKNAISLTLTYPFQGTYLLLTSAICLLFLRSRFNKVHLLQKSLFSLAIIILSITFVRAEVIFPFMLILSVLNLSFLLYIPKSQDSVMYLTLSLSITLFCLAYLYRLHDAFEFFGMVRATNGRYLFALLPFITAVFLSDSKQVNRHSVVVWTFAVAFFLLNINILTGYAIPFLNK